MSQETTHYKTWWFFMVGHQHESVNVTDTDTRNNNIHKDHEQSNKKLSNKQNKDSLTVFHQNICGLLNKKEELLDSNKKLLPNYLYNRTPLNWRVTPILWEPNFVDERTNLGVWVYLFRIIFTVLILIWIDTLMKRI